MHTDVHKYGHTCIRTYLLTDIHAYGHTCNIDIHSYGQTCKRTDGPAPRLYIPVKGKKINVYRNRNIVKKDV